jgi:hypothetical protein
LCGSLVCQQLASGMFLSAFVSAFFCIANAAIVVAVEQLREIEMIAPPFNPADMDTALDAFKAEYERLVTSGLDPSVVVIAMSELIAFCLAHKAVTGGDVQGTLTVWREAFESSYRSHIVAANN